MLTVESSGTRRAIRQVAANQNSAGMLLEMYWSW